MAADTGGPGDGNAERNGRSVLVVDDDSEFLAAIRRCLSAEGHQVLTALSPLEALWILEQWRIDVVVCDWQLRGADGLALLGVVRERWPRVARVLVSGLFDRLGSRETSPAAQAVLAKPCDPEALAALVAALPRSGPVDEAVRRDRRRWQRAPLFVAARVSRDEQAADCVAEHLSAGGARLVGAPRVPVGTLVRVTLWLSATNVVHAAAHVVRVDAQGAGECTCAVTFHRLAPDAEDRIHQAVLEHLERVPRVEGGDGDGAGGRA